MDFLIAFQEKWMRLLRLTDVPEVRFSYALFPNCKAWNCYGCHSGVFELLERSTYGTCSDFISAKENFMSCDFCIKGFLCYTIWSPVCRICNFHSSGCYYVSAFPETGYCRNDSRCSERIEKCIKKLGCQK